MNEPRPPLRRPVLGLVVVAMLFLIPIGAVLIWQQVRWSFAAPLAIVFQEHDVVKDGVDIRHAEVRKFISVDVFKAEELAKSAGFECNVLTFAKGQAICYRDVWTRLCKDIWSLELSFDDKRKILLANGRKRRVCLF